jgi:HlyD family secretion protein
MTPPDQLRLRIAVALPLASLLLCGSGCRDGSNGAFAYGNFEADEVIVSSEIGGRLLWLDASEGDYIQSGVSVGLVDTVQLSLQRDELIAQRAVISSRTPGIVAQVDVIEAQRRVAQTERTRIENLLADGAATRKQLDDIDGQLRVLESQATSIRAQNAPLIAELRVVDAKRALVDDQIRRGVIRNPVGGTVLLSYTEPLELVQPGKALYRIANLDTIYLRAYVSGGQLAGLRLGQRIFVEYDRDAQSNHRVEGVVTWISSQAEFTPKLIQTKEERVNLVYAFKVRVPNADGALKIGMPGEVWRSDDASAVETTE